MRREALPVRRFKRCGLRLSRGSFRFRNVGIQVGSGGVASDDQIVVGEEQIDAALGRLVDRGELTREQADAVAVELRVAEGRLPPQPPPSPTKSAPPGVAPGTGEAPAAAPAADPGEAPAPAPAREPGGAPAEALAREPGEGPAGEPGAARREDVEPSAVPAVAEPGPTASETTPEAAAEAAPLEQPASGRLAEVAGYVGAALVIGAAILFLSQSWDTMGKLGRVTVHFGIAVVLAIAGGLVAASAAGPVRRLRDGVDPVRARLAGTLFSAAAASAAFGMGLSVDTGVPNQPAPLLAAGLTGAALATLGYLIAPAAITQLVISLSIIVLASGILLFFADGLDYAGFVVLVLGAVWAALAGFGLLRERRFGAGLGALLALLGAQWTLVAASLDSLVAYALTAAVAAASFVAYVWLRAWPYLAVGVAGAMLAATEFVVDVTGGSLGAAGVLLVAGITLLLASALGLRLRRAAP